MLKYLGTWDTEKYMLLNIVQCTYSYVEFKMRKPKITQIHQSIRT